VRVRLVAGGPFAPTTRATSTPSSSRRATTRRCPPTRRAARRSPAAAATRSSSCGGRSSTTRPTTVAGGSDDSQYWTKALIDGNVHFKNKNAGRSCGSCSATPRRGRRTRSTRWSRTSTLRPRHRGNVGGDRRGLEHPGREGPARGPRHPRGRRHLLADGDRPRAPCLGRRPGRRRLSASVTFTAGDNIGSSAQRQVHARETISRALVQGTKKTAALTYRWVSSAGTETLLGGRREGFVEYQATPTRPGWTRPGSARSGR
jgi:hypothetical protein